MSQHEESSPLEAMGEAAHRLADVMVEPQKEEMSPTSVGTHLTVTEAALLDLESNLDRLSQRLMPIRLPWETEPSNDMTTSVVEIPRSEVAERIGHVNSRLWMLAAAVHRMTEEVDL